jgi:hypothetical protein
MLSRHWNFCSYYYRRRRNALMLRNPLQICIQHGTWLQHGHEKEAGIRSGLLDDKIQGKAITEAIWFLFLLLLLLLLRRKISIWQVLTNHYPYYFSPNGRDVCYTPSSEPYSIYQFYFVSNVPNVNKPRLTEIFNFHYGSGTLHIQPKVAIRKISS